METKNYFTFNVSKAENGFLLEAEYKVKDGSDGWDYMTDKFVFTNIEDVFVKVKGLMGIV